MRTDIRLLTKTSKPVLYRRWPDSWALLRDVLLRTLVAAAPSRDTGSYRTDMLAVFDGLLAARPFPYDARRSRRRETPAPALHRVAWR
jgi:hypothetical protein